jgi:hypothetical protein
MKPAFTARSLRSAPRAELPPLTWPAPLDALPPLGAAQSADSPLWPDTQALPAPTEHGGLFDIERGTHFEESLNGLQVRELIGSKLFERLFGERT